MRRITVLMLLTLAAAGQDAAFTKAKKAYDAAVAAEKATVLEIRRELETLAAAEDAVARVARQAMASAERDVGKLDAIEARIGEKFDERLAVSVDVAKLQTEAALLRKWFDEITAGTTAIPVALRMAGIQLTELARVGAINRPGRTSFSTAHELRRYLADVKRRLTRATEKQSANKARLDREIEALKKQLEAALADTASGVETSEEAMKAMLGAAKRVADKRMALLKRRRELLDRHGALMRVASTYTPPILQEVRISAGNQLVYSAQWITDGKLEEVRKVDQLIKAVNAKIRDVSKDIYEMESERRATNAARLKKAVEMHRLARVLEAYANEYRTVIIGEADAKALVDVCVAVVSFCATGGAATLAQAGNRMVAELEKKAVDPRGLVRALPPGTPDRVYRLLMRHLGETAEAPLKRMSSQAFRAQMIREYVNAAEVAARAEGRNIARATAAARREAQQALAQMQATLRAREQGYAKLIAEAKEAAGRARPRMGLKSTGRIGRAAFFKATAGDGWLQPRDLDAETLKVIGGDVLAGGMSTVGGMYLNQRLATPDLSRWTSLKESFKPKNFKSNLRGQGLGMLITAAGTGVKVYITREFGAQANRAITEFWVRYAELAVKQAAYVKEVAYDRKVYETLHDARRQQALLENDLVTLRKPRTLKRDTPRYIWDPGSEVVVRLVFSNFVPKAPVVTLGPVPMTLRAEGDPRTARVWIAKAPAKKLRPGRAKLKVALAPGTKPWDSLDADPSKRAFLFIPVISSWRDWEKGTDENHEAEVDFEIGKAIEGLRSYSKSLAEHAKRGNELYGGGPDRATGWNGMEKSVRAAHERVGAPAQGDPNGNWWMAGNRFGLAHSGAQNLTGPVNHFAGVLRQMAAGGKKMGAAERKYYDEAIAALYLWYKTRDSWYGAARGWLERKAMFGLIGKVKDPARREALKKENQAAVARVEKLLRSMTPALERFKR